MEENRYRDRINDPRFCIEWAYLGHVAFMAVGACHSRHCGPFQWFGRCRQIFIAGAKRPSSLSCSSKKKTRGNRLNADSPFFVFLNDSHLEFQGFYAFCISHAIMVCLQSTDVVTEPTPAGTGEMRSTMGSTWA